MAESELITKANSSAIAVAFKGFLSVGKTYSDMVTEARAAGDSVAEAFAIAIGMRTLQDLILHDELVMQTIVFLRGSSMGFRTDCDHKDDRNQYSNSLLATIASEATVNGLRLTGNEINIIQDQLYITQDGWLAQIERLPGVTEPYCPIGTIRPDEFETRTYMTKGYKDKPPQEKTKITATVSAQASCYVWGRLVEVRAEKTDVFDSRVQVTTISDFPDEVIDQIKGKVKARMWHDLFLKCEALAKAGLQAEIAAVPQKLLSHPATKGITHTPEPEADPPKQVAAAVVDTAAAKQEAADAVIRRTVSRKGKQEQGQTILRSSPAQVAEFDAIWNEIAGITTMRELDQIGEALKQPDIPYASLGKDPKQLIKWLWADKKKELEATVAP